MKKAVLTMIVMFSGVSAMAQYYPGPIPAPPPPVYYPGGGGGGYYQRDRADDAASAMSAGTGAALLSLASMCASGPGCYYKTLINSAKDDAAIYLVDGSRGANLERAFEELRKAMPHDQSSDEQLAQEILNFQAQ